MQASTKPGYVPAAERPEVAFLPSLIDAFIRCLGSAVSERPPRKPKARQKSQAKQQGKGGELEGCKGHGRGGHGSRERWAWVTGEVGTGHGRGGHGFRKSGHGPRRVSMTSHGSRRVSMGPGRVGLQQLNM
eukprot:23762-Chlamydomonas_euryale.AAC.1